MKLDKTISREKGIFVFSDPAGANFSSFNNRLFS